MSDTSSTLCCRACGEELGFSFLYSPDNFAYHHGCFPRSPSQDEIDRLTAKIAEQAKEIEAVKRERDELKEADGNFWTAIDRAEAAEARATALEERVKRLEMALRNALGDQYDLLHTCRKYAGEAQDEDTRRIRHIRADRVEERLNASRTALAGGKDG